MNKKKTGFLSLCAGIALCSAGCSMTSLEKDGSAWWCKDANYTLGNYYQTGKSEENAFASEIQPDIKKSCYFYDRSVSQKSPKWIQSFGEVGICYLTGEYGIKVDENKFFQLVKTLKQGKDDAVKSQSLQKIFINFEIAEDKLSIPLRSRFLKELKNEYCTCRSADWVYKAVSKNYGYSEYKENPAKSKVIYERVCINLKRDEMRKIAEEIVKEKNPAGLRKLCQKYKIPAELATYLELSQKDFVYGKGVSFNNFTTGESLYAANFQANMNFPKDLPNLPPKYTPAEGKNNPDKAQKQKEIPELDKKIYMLFDYRAVYPNISWNKFFSKECWADLGEISKKGIKGVKAFRQNFISNGYEDFGRYFAHDTGVDNDGLLGEAISGDLMGLLGGQNTKKQRNSYVYFPILDSFTPQDFALSRITFPKMAYSQMPAQWREKQNAIEKKRFLRLSDDRLPDAKLGIIRVFQKGKAEDIVKELKSFQFSKQNDKKTFWLAGTFYKITSDNPCFAAAPGKNIKIIVRTLDNNSIQKAKLERITEEDPLYETIRKGLKEIEPSKLIYCGYKDDGSCCRRGGKAYELYYKHYRNYKDRHEQHTKDAKEDLEKRIARYHKYIVRQIPKQQAEKAFRKTGHIPASLGLPNSMQDANEEFLSSAGKVNMTGTVNDRIPMIEIDPNNEPETLKAIFGLKTNLVLSAVFMQVNPMGALDQERDLSQIIVEDHSIIRKAKKDYPRIKNALKGKKVKVIQGGSPLLGF